MKTPLLLGLAPLLLALGCGNPADNVPTAAVSSNTNAPASAPAAAGKTYALNAETSKIEWIGSKITGKHEGGFKKFSGEFTVADGKLAGAGNKIVIDTTSLYSDNERLTGHLKNADFFNVEAHPTATFVSTAVTQNGANSTVTGNLTLHGITKQISFPAAIEVSDSAVSVKAEFVLDRFDFEMKYAGKADDLIRKEVVLKLDVKAAPAA